MLFSKVTAILVFFVILVPLSGQDLKNERLIPESWNMPDPLLMVNGDLVGSRQQWNEERRPEILTLFEKEVYGKIPGRPPVTLYETLAIHEDALNGKAVQKQVNIKFSSRSDGPDIHLAVFYPKNASGPVPLFLGLNFYGNHSIHPDSTIIMSDRWMRNIPDMGVVDFKATQQSRGISSSRWPLETIIKSGYGVATAYYGDIFPDYPEGFIAGREALRSAGITTPEEGEWGAISAWAWCLIRAVDYLESDGICDPEKIIVFGHSRLGKTALWAGANDERFSLVISNNSGCMGAALCRRRSGETVEQINDRFPHWFSESLTKFNEKEYEMPVDQHMLIALIAPRPVLVCSAAEDLWADPLGEFLSAREADPVYRLLTGKGIGSFYFPETCHLISSSVGYHIREGEHDLKPEDWAVFIEFANLHLR
ncbi:MAG: acetylxylan esterase [Bacteroidales bacterium]|nr:MAG: acetylxylan esterase [Bacteroidales bacterium]